MSQLEMTGTGGAGNTRTPAAVTNASDVIIAGITGMLRAGKGSIAEILVRKYGFKHYSVRQFLIEELERRNLPVNRDTMTPLANELREEFGAQYIVQRLYEQAAREGGNAIIESIRNVGEISYLRMFPQFYLIGVDADIRLRFERAVKEQSVTDKGLTFEKFVEDEQRESTSEDPNKQNLRACMELTNFTIINEGSVEQLEGVVDQLYRRMTGKE